MSTLRERNITAAKLAIQTCALQLVARQGYGKTTVEQIAEAAEVSPSTFFRYFKTKEAVLLYDSIDPLIVAAFLRQPSDVLPIRAMRNAVKDLGSTLPKERRQLELQRFKLLNDVPALKNKSFGQMAASIDDLACIIAQRSQKDPDDIAVRNLAGAIVGVMVGVLQQTYKQPTMAIFEGAMDVALARLEKGLEL